MSSQDTQGLYINNAAKSRSVFFKKTWRIGDILVKDGIFPKEKDVDKPISTLVIPSRILKQVVCA